MTKLGVNIDHSATVREARYRETPREWGIVVEPNPLEVALAAERGGADSITAHLREDRRHMRDADLVALRKNIATKLNMEMACADEIVEFAVKLHPDYACLVPENRREVTTEGGIDLISSKDKTARAVERLEKTGTVCSIFIDPNPAQIKIAAEIGATTIELHTGAYANASGNESKTEAELARISAAAAYAKSLGLTVNSGHGINYLNVVRLLQVADFNELNIGHTIISRAILVGMERAVAEMKELIAKCPNR